MGSKIVLKKLLLIDYVGICRYLANIKVLAKDMDVLFLHKSKPTLEAGDDWAYVTVNAKGKLDGRVFFKLGHELVYASSTVRECFAVKAKHREEMFV